MFNIEKNENIKAGYLLYAIGYIYILVYPFLALEDMNWMVNSNLRLANFDDSSFKAIYTIVSVISYIFLTFCIFTTKKNRFQNGLGVVSGLIINLVFLIVEINMPFFKMEGYSSGNFLSLLLNLPLIISIILILLFFKKPSNGLKIGSILFSSISMLIFLLTGVIRYIFFSFFYNPFYSPNLSEHSTLFTGIIFCLYYIIVIMQINKSFSFNKIVQPVPIYSQPVLNNTDKDVSVLLDYKKLLDEGIITQEEFDRKKKEVLK